MIKDTVVMPLMFAALCSVAGYLYGEHREREAQEALRAESVAVAEQTLHAEYKARIAESHTAVVALRKDKQRLEKLNATLEQEIEHVARPDCAFSHGFKRVYNRAIGVGVSASDSATRADREAATGQAAGPSDDDISDITQADVLHHINDYGSRCQAIEAQLNQLIDYLENQNR
jgi:hypothetical protein